MKLSNWMRRKHYSKEIIKSIYKRRYRITEEKTQWKSDEWVL